MSPLISLLVALSSSQVPPPQASCLSQYGKTVCGFHCVAQYGDVKCAQTPAGTCKAEYGQVTCWDPPVRERRPHREENAGLPPPLPPANAGPESRCVSAYGKTTCGFACVAQYGDVKCAQTPQGACKAEYGQVTCWDPPRPFPGAPAAECVSNYGVTACGYGCVANYGQVKCAQTPQGTCRAASGEVTCWDPQRR